MDTCLENNDGEFAYWYKDFWLHRIYCIGLEFFVNNVRENIPCIENDGNGVRATGISHHLFYWDVLYKTRAYDQGKPIMEVLGKSLFVKSDIDKEEFIQIVQVRFDFPGSHTGRLYAAKQFEIGDAILFYSELEESTRDSVFGGVHVREVDSLSDCNAYLTKNRTLRCTKPIYKGEEITRCRSMQKLEYLERADRIVVSLETMAIGRIGHEYVASESHCLVHFPDDTIEMGKRLHYQLFKGFPLVNI